MSTGRVRRAQADDWREYRSIRLAALRDSPGAFSSTLADAERLTDDDWRRRCDAAACFLATVDGQPAGLVAGLVEDGHAELVSMWVAPAHRGSGVASMLVEAVVGWAATAGHARIALWVTVDNLRAQRLYSRHGFESTGEIQPMREDTPDRLELRMARSVGVSPGDRSER